MRRALPALLFAVLFGVLVLPPAAAAQDAVQKVTDINKKAVEAYDNLDMDEAQKLLKQALELCAAEGLTSHKVKARSHMNLGIVYVGGLKQRDKGVDQFKRALEIDPTIKPTLSLLTPEIQSAYEEASKGGGGARPPEPPVDTRPTVGSDGRPPRSFKGIFHDSVTEAKPNSTVTIKAAIEPGLAFDKMILAYRPEGAPDYLARDMEKDDLGWYVARIPDPATQGNVVAYYIEARNRGGQPVVANGSAGEPHVITLAVPQATTDEPSGKDEPGDGDAGSKAGRVWFVIAVGGGGGYAKGTPELNPTKGTSPIKFDGGIAPAKLLHFAPELGYFATSNLLISLQGRIQMITGATEVKNPRCPGGTCQPAKWAPAALVKATWFFGGSAALRPFVAFAAGGGVIRHVVSISSLSDCGADRTSVCQDTVAGGKFLFGPAAGLSYDFTDSVALVTSLNALVGVPDITANLDLNLGLALSF